MTWSEKSTARGVRLFTLWMKRTCCMYCSMMASLCWMVLKDSILFGAGVGWTSQMRKRQFSLTRVLVATLKDVLVPLDADVLGVYLNETSCHIQTSFRCLNVRQRSSEQVLFRLIIVKVHVIMLSARYSQ